MNIFLNLPMPIGNGAGAAVDTSAMGKDKSIVVGGSFVGASVAIEISNDGGVTFQPIWLFTAEGKKVIPAAAQFMRVSVLGRGTGLFTANADVGANDNGALFVVLPLPVGDGASAPINVSALGNFTTFVVGGQLEGTSIAVEVSEDGIGYSTCAMFSGRGGEQSKVVVGNFMRTFVRGRAGNTSPFAPSVGVGAVNDAVSVAATGGDISAVLEKWTKQNVIFSLVNVPLDALVSTSFDEIKAIRAGSIRGLSTRLTGAITDIAAGSMIVTVTINGVAGTLQISHNAGGNASGGEATQAQGVDVFAAGDLIGIQITTLASYTPIGLLDLEAWLDVSYA